MRYASYRDYQRRRDVRRRNPLHLLYERPLLGVLAGLAFGLEGIFAAWLARRLHRD